METSADPVKVSVEPQTDQTDSIIISRVHHKKENPNRKKTEDATIFKSVNELLLSQEYVSFLTEIKNVGVSLQKKIYRMVK